MIIPNFINTLDERLQAKSTLIQVLIGPRQVGKTTSVLNLIEKQFKGRAIYESCDRVFHASSDWLIGIWERARKEKKILFIDEIQKCENWSEIIKKLWDLDKRKGESISCVLMGSSSLEIHRGLTESLTGRFQQIFAHHWNFEESKKAYGLNFEDFLKFGGYPGSYHLLKNESEWVDYIKNSIVGTVVEKDILQYHNVKSPALFRQAFEILCSYPAQEISYTKLLGQIQDRGNVELIKNYLHFYQGAFLIRVLEKFSLNKIRLKSSSPKILPLAPCLYYLQILNTYSSEEQGHVFELIVGAQLNRLLYSLYYWREGNFEVDYIVQSGKKICAIEVKSSRKKKTKGLARFKELYPQATCVIIDSENYFQFEKNPEVFLGMES